MSKTQTSVWSCGGGRQSTAIAGLIVKGILPKPDYSVMVDVGYEKSSTWRYTNTVLIPALAEVGVHLEIIDKAKYATVDLWGGADGNTLLLPVFTDKAGRVGKMANFCSGEWKKRVLERHMKRTHHVSTWVSWMGMSTNEMRRVRIKDGETGSRNEYPLIFGPRPMSSQDCIRFVVEEMGWPEPPSSSCGHCPNHTDKQWKQLRDDDPADFQKAVLLDEQMRKTDPNAYLHKSCKPLGEVDFDTLCASQDGGLFAGLEGCDSGYCFT